MDGVADRGAAWREVQESVSGGDSWDLYGDSDHVVYLLCTSWRGTCAGLNGLIKNAKLVIGLCIFVKFTERKVYLFFFAKVC